MLSTHPLPSRYHMVLARAIWAVYFDFGWSGLWKEKGEREEERGFRSELSNTLLDGSDATFGYHVGSVTWYPLKKKSYVRQ